MIICPKCGKTYQSIPFYMHCFYCNFSFDTPAKAQAEAVASPHQEQVAGDHYKKLGDAQPWKVLPTWFTPDELRGYAKGEAIVYLCRERNKGGDEDIRKAHHVLSLYLETLNKDEKTNEDC